MKALIIGAGAIADSHCEALSLLGVEIGGICATRLNSAKRLTDLYGGTPFDNLDDALQQPFDIAAICTPNGTHVQLAIDAMRAGLHVAVEKPLALTVEDCLKMQKVSEETNKICAPIAQIRTASWYRKAQAYYDSGALGKPIMSALTMKHFRTPEYYDSNWKGTVAMDGGELMNQGLHGIDLMCGLLGCPTSVSGKVATIYHNIEAEDTSVAHFVFENGMLGTMESSAAIRGEKPRKLEIYGSLATLVIEDNSVVLTQNENGSPITPEIPDFAQVPADASLHYHMYRNILSAIAGEEALEYTLSDALDAIRVICAICKSSDSGKTIKLQYGGCYE